MSVALTPRIKGTTIWDPVRKKWIALTPEEYVRQSLLLYLHHKKKYPYHIISVEKEIHYQGLKRRYDIVIFDKNMQPFTLIECKAPNIAIQNNSALIRQILTYYLVVQTRYFILTNGQELHCYEKKEGKFIPIPDIPSFL